MAKEYDPISDTKNFEGFRSKVYKDTRGIPTIGYGFNLKDGMVQKLLPVQVVMGQRELTREEAEPVFNALYKRAETTAKQYVGPAYDTMNPKMRGIINDMAYNMGDKLFQFKGMKQALLAGDMPRVAAEMEDSAWFGQVGNRSKAHVASVMSMTREA